MKKVKLKDRPVFQWIKEKFPETDNTQLGLIEDLTGKESLESLGKLVGAGDELSSEEYEDYHQMMEGEYQQLELELKDRDSARNRELEIAKTPKKDYMIAFTGIIGLGLLVFLAVAIIFIPSVNENKLLIHLLGIVEGVAISIFGYYFGSSKESVL